MANTVGNHVSVRGPRKVLHQFMESVREQPPSDHPDPLYDIEVKRSWLSLGQIIPKPDEIPDSGSFQMINGKLDWEIWQEWLHENWGTKWIMGVDVRWVSATELHYFFESAWNPPLALFDHLARRFPRLAFSLDATDINMERQWRAEWSNGKRKRSVEQPMSRAKCADVRMAEYTPDEDEGFEEVLDDYATGYRYRPRKELHVKRGMVYLKWGRPNEAAEEFGRAIRIDEGYAAAYTQRAVAFRQLKHYDHAEADHRRAIRLTPKDAEAHYEYGYTLFERVEFSSSLECFKKAIKADAFFLPPHVFLASFDSSLGYSIKAEEEFTRILELNPTNFLAHRDYADFLMRQGEAEKAALHYTEAMRLRLLTEFLLLRRGLCFLLCGQLERAVGDLTQLSNNRWEGSDQMAASLSLQLAVGLDKVRKTDIDRVRKAIQAIDGDGWKRSDIAEVWQNFSAGLLTLAVRSWTRGESRNSIRQLGMASSADPDNAEPLYLLAWALATCPQAKLRNGRRAAVLAHRAERLAKGRKNPAYVLLCILAATQAAAGNYAEATNYQQAAIESIPKDDDGRYLVKWCCNGFRSVHMGIFWPYQVSDEGTIRDRLLRAYRRRLRLYRAKKSFHLGEK